MPVMQLTAISLRRDAQQLTSGGNISVLDLGHQNVTTDVGTAGDGHGGRCTTSVLPTDLKHIAQILTLKDVAMCCPIKSEWNHSEVRASGKAHGRVAITAGYHLGLRSTITTESPRRNILLTKRSLLTG